MTILQIRLHNFRSFRGDAVIDVRGSGGDGGGGGLLTCVLGPNGSGKSNLLDAVGFVLGMPASMLRCTNRASQSHNINSDYSELVSLGESHASVTLLLGPDRVEVERSIALVQQEEIRKTKKRSSATSVTVVVQLRCGGVVLKSEEQLREFFFSHYGRAYDIFFPARLAIFQHSVAALASMAPMEVLDRIEETVGTRAMATRAHELEDTLAALVSDVEEKETRLADVEEKVDAYTAAMQLVQKLLSKQKEVNKFQSRLDAINNAVVRKRIYVAKKRIKALGAELTAAESERRDAMQSLLEARKKTSLPTLEAKQASTKKELAAVQSRLRQLQSDTRKHSHGVAMLSHAIQVSSSSSTTTRGTTPAGDNDESTLPPSPSPIEELTARRDQIETMLAASRAEAASMHTKYRPLEQQLDALSRNVREHEEAVRRDREAKQKEEAARLDSSAKARAVRQVMSSSTGGGVLGFLCDVIEIASGHHARAVNSVLSGHLSNTVVCATRADALCVVQFFSSERVGIVTCLVLDELEVVTAAEKPELSPASASFPLEYCVRARVTGRASAKAIGSRLIPHLLGRWLFIDAATESLGTHGTGKIHQLQNESRRSVVTRDGDMFCLDGEVRGGATHSISKDVNHSTMALRVASLSNNVQNITTANQCTSPLSNNEVNLASAKAQLDALRTSFETSGGGVWRQNVTAIENQVKELQQELTWTLDAMRSCKEQEKKKDAVNASATAGRRSSDMIDSVAMCSKLEERKKELAALEANCAQHEETAAKLQDSLKSINRSLTNAKARLGKLENAAEAAKVRISSLRWDIKTEQAVLQKEMAADDGGSGDDSEVASPSLAELEQRQRTEKAKFTSLWSQLQRLAHDVDIDSLQDKAYILDDHERLCQDIDTAWESITTQRDELDELQKKRLSVLLAALSGINQTLHRVMGEIGGPGYDSQAVYVNGGGLLRSGVSFVIRTPSNTDWRDVATLSGGQRAMVSIAIMFALQMMVSTAETTQTEKTNQSDSPGFYLLDEVDAALDSVHVARLGAFLHSVTTIERTHQFLCVSLRHELYERASDVVGVYHSRPGCSVAVSLSDLNNNSGDSSAQ
eukprot:PhM_4_TR2830/c0_g1_i1/m.54375